MMDAAKQSPGDDDDGWLRQFVLPEEYLIAHYPMARGSSFRWFQSDNVIDLVRIRRQRAKQQSSHPTDPR